MGRRGTKRKLDRHAKNTIAIECQNVHLPSKSGAQEIVGLRTKDILEIAMPDVILIAEKNRAGKFRPLFGESF